MRSDPKSDPEPDAKFPEKSDPDPRKNNFGSTTLVLSGVEFNLHSHETFHWLCRVRGGDVRGGPPGQHEKPGAVPPRHAHLQKLQPARQRSAHTIKTGKIRCFFKD